ncbi:FtsP/CotA-like multicopper oxidase with cupredoxin domain [Trinickia symbiotica]|uniref:Multicopper oxidase family protein n=1 Tax=Trinickia symbiotica TaxID=863227 RepID=A0A2N7X1T4_9BURK|nr:multicopper oxidase family protein [Trinickia symbiotica]PMS35597.1 multicopper oxidase family protein [Trinickia symbiotica]PPK47659.1 FtsP/CotA-like multicopper oxidase with cupredoxin domain [Trinickia symbiotica]
MSHITWKTWNARLARFVAIFVGMLFSVAVRAAVPGVAGPTFDLTAEQNRVNQPDGQSIYSWGYGCNPRTTVNFLPSANPLDGANCQSMQVPGPTLIVKQGDVVTITLTNNLPAAAGNTSMLFPGFQVCAAKLNTDGTCPAALTGVPGLLTREAVHGGTVTYSFVATTAGTHAYYSGTQGDLQVEMGLYGALVVLPASGGTAVVPAGCRAVSATLPDGQPDYRDAAAAYNHSETCYDREYLFQFSEIDPRIHLQAEQQANVACTQPTGCMNIQTEPYHPAYFMINGRSMPDDMDANYAPAYPHQPYNGNPHMHPGELVLLRIIGTGRWQHPFHEHGNHVRILARDGNLLLAATDPTKLAGPLLFTTTTTPGIAMDGIFYWTGKGLNWDVYGNTTSGPGSVYNVRPTDTLHTSYNGKSVVCTPDANGYYTADPLAPNYFEWCADHDKPLEAHPFGTVASGGPVTLPDPNIFANGAWYSGSAYLGPDALIRAVGATGTTPPSGLIVNPPTTEAGFAYMWHSHNEREITTNNIFPGGMMMMMLVDPQAFTINESN